MFNLFNNKFKFKKGELVKVHDKYKGDFLAWTRDKINVKRYDRDFYELIAAEDFIPVNKYYVDRDYKKGDKVTTRVDICTLEKYEAKKI